MDDILDLAYTIVDTLEEKKGENILLLDLQEICSFTDFFIISTGVSERTLRALSQDVQKKIKQEHEVNARVEGSAKDGWVLLDYGSVILHLFSPKLRQYYQLEELWRDGQVLLHMQ
jgi:ribosome-associated protein